MTDQLRAERTEFVKRLAAGTGLSDEYAELGFIETPRGLRLAMPCRCDADKCTGWQMVSPAAAPDIALELEASRAEAYHDGWQDCDICTRS